MKVLLIGYGKMGKTIERLASGKSQQIIGYIDSCTPAQKRQNLINQADVGIEFSHPDAAYDNIVQCITQGLPVVSGTTGWLDQIQAIEQLVKTHNGAFFYASNYSIGVNIFWAVNQYLAKIMETYPQYDIQIKEVHHIHKKDEPSGTAITTADKILDHLSRKKTWTLSDQPTPQDIPIHSSRRGEVFGYHEVSYHSPIDTISVIHDAHSRDGFAIGALQAAQWIKGKNGIYTMRDMLGLP